MGKGDKKTKKGKISSGSFGVTRPHKKTTEKATEAVEKKDKTKAKEDKKSEKSEAKTDSKKK